MEKDNNLHKIILSISLILLIVFLAFFAGFNLGSKNNSLTYKSKASEIESKLPNLSGLALPDISSIMSAVGGRITKINAINGKTVIEITGLSNREIFNNFLGKETSFDSLKGKEKTSNTPLPEGPKPSEGKIYIFAVTSETKIISLPEPITISMDDFMKKTPPAPPLPKSLSVSDLKVGTSVTVYPASDQVTASRIEIIPAPQTIQTPAEPKVPLENRSRTNELPLPPPQ